MEQRPVIHLARTKAEIILDVISLFVIISMIAYVAYMWQDMPERMPSILMVKGRSMVGGTK